MVRFKYNEPGVGKKKSVKPLFPGYKEVWTSYDPKNTSNCVEMSWVDLWQKDKVRDELHRTKSYHYGRISDKYLYEEPPLIMTLQPLSIVVFGAFIFIVMVPQLIDLFISIYSKSSPPHPAPPNPPPRPPSRKRLKLFHQVNPRAANATLVVGSSKRKLSSKSMTDLTLHENNILNYVSATRIRALLKYRDEKKREASAATSEVNLV